MIDLLFCDGTWTREGQRSVVGEELRRQLDPSLVRFQYVDYPGTFGPATGLADMSPAESVRVGIDNLTAAVALSPHRVVVAGYSQGAMVAVEFAREVLPRRTDLVVDAVATLGDPYGQPHAGGGSGIAGARSVPCERLTVWVDGDPIGDCPAGSPLRGVADVTEWMSIRSPQDSLRWASRTLSKIPTRLQTWWAPWRWPDLLSAGQLVGNYLGDHHTGRYVSQGHVSRLARTVEGLAR